MRYNEERPPSIMDIEASGFGSGSFPIEVGYVDGRGERFCTLIQPLPHWIHWSDEAEQTHKISRCQLEKAGIDAKHVALQLNQALAGQTFYSDGWVSDYEWLRKLFFDTHTTMSFTLSPLELTLTEPQMEIWHTIYDQLLAVHNKARHRASNDAMLIQETWKMTYQLGQQ